MINTLVCAFNTMSQFLPAINRALKARKMMKIGQYDLGFRLFVVILPGSIPDNFGNEADQGEQR